jgi:hypothetical protein
LDSESVPSKRAEIGRSADLREDMLKEYDCVRLKQSLPEGTVPLGAEGVVLMVYREPVLGYQVEFFLAARSGLLLQTRDHLQYVHK